MDKKFHLTYSDRTHPVWVKLRKHLQDELDLLRRKNDNDYDAVKTASIRGDIGRINKLLALGTTPLKKGIVIEEESQ